MLKRKRNKLKVTSLQVDILSIIAIVVGILGVIVFSMAKQEGGISKITEITLIISIIISIIDIVAPVIHLTTFAWVILRTTSSKELRKEFLNIYYERTYTPETNMFQLALATAVLTFLLILLIIIVLIF